MTVRGPWLREVLPSAVPPAADGKTRLDERFSGYELGAAFDEMFDAAGEARPHCRPLLDELLAASPQDLRARYKQLAGTEGAVALTRGDAKAMDTISGANRIVAEYEFPYLAHAPMEQLNATVKYDGDKAEAWVPSQFQTMDQMTIAQVLGLKPSTLRSRMMKLGIARPR